MNFSETSNLTKNIPHRNASETTDLETTLDQTSSPHHEISLNFVQIILITLAVPASIGLLGFLALKFYKQRKSNSRNLNIIFEKEQIDAIEPMIGEEIEVRIQIEGEERGHLSSSEK
jgi:hypothetical protein